MEKNSFKKIEDPVKFIDPNYDFIEETIIYEPLQQPKMQIVMKEKIDTNTARQANILIYFQYKET